MKKYSLFEVSQTGHRIDESMCTPEDIAANAQYKKNGGLESTAKDRKRHRIRGEKQKAKAEGKKKLSKNLKRDRKRGFSKTSPKSWSPDSESNMNMNITRQSNSLTMESIEFYIKNPIEFVKKPIKEYIENVIERPLQYFLGGDLKQPIEKKSSKIVESGFANYKKSIITEILTNQLEIEVEQNTLEFDLSPEYVKLVEVEPQFQLNNYKTDTHNPYDFWLYFSSCLLVIFCSRLGKFLDEIEVDKNSIYSSYFGY